MERAEAKGLVKRVMWNDSYKNRSPTPWKTWEESKGIKRHVPSLERLHQTNVTKINTLIPTQYSPSIYTAVCFLMMLITTRHYFMYYEYIFVYFQFSIRTYESCCQESGLVDCYIPKCRAVPGKSKCSTKYGLNELMNETSKEIWGREKAECWYKCLEYRYNE